MRHEKAIHDHHPRRFTEGREARLMAEMAESPVPGHVTLPTKAKTPLSDMVDVALREFRRTDPTQH
jgi:hypothetical protein